MAIADKSSRNPVFSLFIWSPCDGGGGWGYSSTRDQSRSVRKCVYWGGGGGNIIFHLHFLYFQVQSIRYGHFSSWRKHMDQLWVICVSYVGDRFPVQRIRQMQQSISDVDIKPSMRNMWRCMKVLNEAHLSAICMNLFARWVNYQFRQFA